MFDMRAYIATLIAVFLSLGIGILLGTVIVDKGSIANQQKTLMQGIRTDIRSALEDNRMLKDELSRMSTLEKQIFPVITKDKLIGKSVVIVSTYSADTADNETLKKINSTIKTAGGTTESVVIKEDALKGTPDIQENMRTVFSASAEKKWTGFLIEGLSQAIALPETPPNLDQLKKIGVLDFSGEHKTVPMAVIIYLSKKDSSSVENIYKPLANNLKQYGLSVVAAEDSRASESFVEKFKNMDISTIDNINEIPGFISLVYALNGRTGNFGVKPGADTLMPDLSQAEQ